MPSQRPQRETAHSITFNVLLVYAAIVIPATVLHELALPCCMCVCHACMKHGGVALVGAELRKHACPFVHAFMLLLSVTISFYNAYMTCQAIQYMLPRRLRATMPARAKERWRHVSVPACMYGGKGGHTEIKGLYESHLLSRFLSPFPV